MQTIRFFSLLLAALAYSTCDAPRAWAVIVAQWTFEAAPVNSQSSVTGPSVAATTGSPSYLFFGKSGSTSNLSWRNAIGNGSNNAYEAGGAWPSGSYWQFNLSTTGFTSLSLSFDVASKASGPRDFKVQTSINGLTYADQGFTYLAPLISPTWDATNFQAPYRIAINDLGAQFDNLPQLYVRLLQTSSMSVNGGTVGTTGASRIDNVTVSGMAISSVPEASALLFAGLVAGVLGLGRLVRVLYV